MGHSSVSAVRAEGGPGAVPVGRRWYNAHVCRSVAIEARAVVWAALVLLPALAGRTEARPALGLALERDSALRAMTDSRDDATAARQRRAVAERVVGPSQVAALELRLGEAPPLEWLEATTGMRRSITLADDPHRDLVEGIAILAEALADDAGATEISLLPLRDATLVTRQLPRIEEAERLLRARLGEVRIVRTLDSRLAVSAPSLWPPEGDAGYDACAVEIVYGHPECDGPRDAGAELDAIRAMVPEGRPLAVTRLAIATACEQCGTRFPEEAAQRAALLLERLMADEGLTEVILDSSDPPAEVAGPSFGLFSSGTVSDALASALTGGGSLSGAVLPTPPARIQDPTVLWVVLTVGLGVGGLIAAIALAGRIRSTQSAPASPSSTRGWRAGGALLLLGGAVLLTYPWWTDQLARQAHRRASMPPARDWFAPPGSERGEAEPCAAPFTLTVPALQVSLPVGDGADEANLRSGPMHYTGTALPGEPSNCCIAGHRSTYGAPFRRLLDLEPGDELTVTGSGGFRRSYRVAWSRVSPASDGRYLAPTETEALTLSTCHPYGLASERLMVRAYPGDAGDAAARCLPLDERLPATRPAVLLASGLGVAGGAWFEAPEPPAPVSPSDAIEWAPLGSESGLGPARAWPAPSLLAPDGAGNRRSDP